MHVLNKNQQLWTGLRVARSIAQRSAHDSLSSRRTWLRRDVAWLSGTHCWADRFWSTRLQSCRLRQIWQRLLTSASHLYARGSAGSTAWSNQGIWDQQSNSFWPQRRWIDRSNLRRKWATNPGYIISSGSTTCLRRTTKHHKHRKGKSGIRKRIAQGRASALSWRQPWMRFPRLEWCLAKPVLPLLEHRIVPAKHRRTNTSHSRWKWSVRHSTAAWIDQQSVSRTRANRTVSRLRS